MLRDTYIWLAAPMCEVAQPQVGLFSRQDQTWAGFIFTDTRCWSWCEVEIDNRPKTGKNLPSGIQSAPLRTGWVVWHQRSLWRASRLKTCNGNIVEIIWRSFRSTSSTLVEMKMSSSFKAWLSFAHFRILATPMSVCNSSANLYFVTFEFWELLTIPFLLNRWSSIHHLQWHVPPSKEKIEIAFSKIQLFIFFTLSHLREISKSKSGSELQAFPHQRLWMSFVGDCGLYKEQPSDHFWKIKQSKKFSNFKTWHLSTKSSCSFNDISRVSTWKVPTKPNYTVTQYYGHLKPEKHHHDDGSWGRETLASQTWRSRAVWESGES